MPDPLAALLDWRRVLRPGGRLLLTSFASAAFEPMAGLLAARLRAAGCLVIRAAPLFPWHRLAAPGLLGALVEAAGFTDLRAERAQLGYHLSAAGGWWEVVWHTELRGLVEALAPAQQGVLRVAHLAEVAPLVGPDGLWMDVDTVLLEARNPG
jgi:hypothetical protein